jgi:hypothetical protein
MSASHVHPDVQPPVRVLFGVEEPDQLIADRVHRDEAFAERVGARQVPPSWVHPVEAAELRLAHWVIVEPPRGLHGKLLGQCRQNDPASAINRHPSTVVTVRWAAVTHTGLVADRGSRGADTLQIVAEAECDLVARRYGRSDGAGLSREPDEGSPAIPSIY